jgi:hypothetical protein
MLTSLEFVESTLLLYFCWIDWSENNAFLEFCAKETQKHFSCLEHSGKFASAGLLKHSKHAKMSATYWSQEKKHSEQKLGVASFGQRFISSAT